MNLNDYYKKNSIEIVSRPMPLDFVGMRDYLIGRRTPVRILEEDFIKDFMPLLKGKVIELGANKNSKYGKFAICADEYILSNLSKDDKEVLRIDILSMDLEDNSVDAFVCLNVLEHIHNPERAICEMKRVLKPGGIILLAAPFVYCFHPAPDDFYRFSPSALLENFKDFHIIRCETLGNFWSVLATFIQKPGFKGRLKIWDIFIHMIGLIFCLLSRMKRYQDEYLMTCCLVAEKKHV